MNVPARLHSANEKLEAGEFKSAVHELKTVYDESHPVDRVLLAELMLRQGQLEQGMTLAQSVMNERVPLDVRARGLEHLGYASRHKLNLSGAIRLFERSVRAAGRAGDHNQVCRSQLHLLSARADAFGPDSLGDLPRVLRKNVRVAGDPSLWFSLHWRFAEIEARRSDFVKSERHLEHAGLVLDKHPSSWQEARLNLLRGVVSEATSQLSRAIAYSTRALDAAKSAGFAFIEVAALSNLAHLYTSAGQLEAARSHLANALSMAAEWPTLQKAVAATAARLELLCGSHGRCEQLLAECGIPRAGSAYSRLDNALTRIALLRERGARRLALQTTESNRMLAEKRGARLLAAKFVLFHADILVDLDRHDEARKILSTVDVTKSGGSLGIIAWAERIQGRIALKAGAQRTAQVRLQRAHRILEFVGDQLEKEITARELARRHVDDKCYEPAGSLQNCEQPPNILGAQLCATTSARMLLEFGHHPVLLGREVLCLLVDAGAVKRAVITSFDGDARTVVQHVDWSNFDPNDFSHRTVRIVLGREHNGSYELLVDPERTLVALELVRLFAGIVECGIEVAASRRQRSDGASLWPTADLPAGAEPKSSAGKMRTALAHATRLAKADLAAILVTGETGVGKEFIARSIHAASKRAAHGFAAINCAAIPHQLFESHVFGHLKGAFTGAVNDAPGVIRACEGGTVFLDEIGELQLDLQVKLLRFLDAREVHPIGATRAIPVDVSIIAATNADVRQLIQQGRFREDLFYRLTVASLAIPPLRARQDDLPTLARHFLGLFCARGQKPPLRISDAALDYLMNYGWPGNVRELKNEMERLVGMLPAGESIKPADLKREIVSPPSGEYRTQERSPSEVGVRTDQGLENALATLESQMIVSALARREGSYTLAARDLGISRKGLFNKRLRLGLF